MSAASTEDLVAAVRRHALANYTEGWDVIVEAFTDPELADLIDGAVSETGAILKTAQYVGLHSEQAANVRNNIDASEYDQKVGADELADFAADWTAES